MSPSPPDHQPAIAECRLDARGLGAQLTRYRQLAGHATSVERHTGHVLVRFANDVPLGLLGRTLDVERRCCPFVYVAYDERDRALTLTVENVDQDPRLDSLFYALTREA